MDEKLAFQTDFYDFYGEVKARSASDRPTIPDAKHPES